MTETFFSRSGGCRPKVKARAGSVAGESVPGPHVAEGERAPGPFIGALTAS